MANWYVYSGAAGAGTGADWANAFTTLAAAFAGGAAGDTFYVADDHAAATNANVTLTSPGTAANPCRVVCVRRSGGSVPPVSADLRATAVESVTGGNSLSFAGFAVSYGVTYTAGSGTATAASLNFASASPWWWRIEGGGLSLNNSSATSRLTVGASGNTNSDDQLLELVNAAVTFGSSSQQAVVRCPVTWRGGSLAGTAPSVLFSQTNNTAYGWARLDGVDLSAMGSGCSLVSVSTNAYGFYDLHGCKLGSSVAVTTGSVAGQGGVAVRLVNCDSADTNYRYLKQVYQGTITQETTVVRSGGASDGTTTVSRKMVSTANSRFYSPLESDPIFFWNETVGSSITATVEVVTDGVTLTDADCWLEAEYLGTSGYPLASFASDRAADVLASGSNQTSSSVTWTTTGLASPVKQSLSVTFTPQEKGPVLCRVMLARASTTVYYDPKALDGSGRQYMLPGGFVNEGASGGLLVHHGMTGGMRG